MNQKNSFVLYTEYLQHMELMSMEQRGQFITAVMCYASGTELPEMDDVVKMAFSFVRAQLDRDSEQYQEKIKARKEAGSQGGRPKANGFSEKQTEAKKANGFSEKQTEAKKANGFSEKQTKAKKANGFSEKQTKAKKANGFFEKQNNPDNVDVYVDVDDDVDVDVDVNVDDDVDDNADAEKKDAKASKEKRFAPPSLDDVKAYCLEHGYHVDAQSFVDFYESKGWMIGKNRMKDWKAAVRMWERRERDGPKSDTGNAYIDAVRNRVSDVDKWFEEMKQEEEWDESG